MALINRQTVPAIDLITVPAGEFILGPGPILSREGPIPGEPHPVYLAEYKLGKYPVTNAQYRLFVEDTEPSTPLTWKNGYPSGKSDHLVSGVVWSDAWLFCAWLREKTRRLYHLPIEPEWE